VPDPLFCPYEHNQNGAHRRAQGTPKDVLIEARDVEKFYDSSDGSRIQVIAPSTLTTRSPTSNIAPAKAGMHVTNAAAIASFMIRGSFRI
jgi:hypothetical protein